MYKTIEGLTMCKDVICMIIIDQKREKEGNDIGAISMYYIIKLALL